MTELNFDETREKFPRWLLVAGTFFVLGLVAVTYGLMQMQNSEESVEIIKASQDHPSSEGDQVAVTLVKVDIGGAVERPGLYQLEANARVADVIERAGGIKNSAHIEYVNKQLNLAQQLTDGQKIYIPFQDENVESKSSSTQVSGVKNGTININTATASELDSLVGIGEARAAKIIENRPYLSINELVSKGVITKSVLDNIINQIDTR